MKHKGHILNYEFLIKYPFFGERSVENFALHVNGKAGLLLENYQQK
jgi:hypothetical protein